ncbi:MAG: MATE family efflux transporter, partial [Spirochaetia bacterium]|nr:MATE family efflux transporter [Spirochaetia bacterium]
ALGTTLSCTITSLLLLLIITKKNTLIRLPLDQPYHHDRQIQKHAIMLALPMALERSTLSFGQIVFTKLVGGLGTKSLAAHFLAISAESITYLPSSGFATAATTLVAQALGSKNKSLARKYSNICMLWGTLLMSFMGIVLYLGSPMLMRFFTNDTQVIALGITILRIEAFAQTGFGLSILAFGIFRGAGDTRRPFLIAVAGMWLIRLPLSLILLRWTSLGLLGIWIAMMVDLNLRGIICFVQYRRFTFLDSWKEMS